MRNSRATYLLTAASAVGLLLGTAACHPRPDGVLDDDATASLLADMHVAEAYTMLGTSDYTSGSDSAKKVLRQSVLKRHGVDQATFDSTLSWYGHNLDKYEEMYEQVMVNIDRKQRDIAAAAGTGDDQVIGNSKWPYPLQVRLQGGSESAATLPFRIDEPLSKGGRLTWEGKTVNAQGPMDVFLAVEYTDGTTAYITRTISGDGRQSVSLQTDSTLKPRRAWGYLRTRQQAPLLLDSVTLQTLPLNSGNYYEYHQARTLKFK